jgi:hypothetical protein
MELGKYIRAARVRAGLTQEQAAGDVRGRTLFFQFENYISFRYWISDLLVSVRSVFWLGGSGVFALFFALFVLKIIFPVNAFVVSVLLGFLNCYPLFRIFYIFGFGLMPYFSYTISNMIGTGRIHILDMDQFFIGLCLSAVGILFGWFIRFLSLSLAKWIDRMTDHRAI